MSKVRVIGLDGGTFRVVDYLIGQGRLPAFSRIIDDGSRATLKSTRPPLTPAAWASFYTGANPGKHGVVDFFTRLPGTYKLTPVSAQTVKGRAVWSIASDHGKRVCVYNVPLTYPAIPVNGIMISGMDAPGLDARAFSPSSCRDEILGRFPDFEIDPAYNPIHINNHFDDPVGEYIQRLDKYLRLQLDVIRHLMQKEDWDLFVAVIRSPDSFQHTFWDSVETVITQGVENASPEVIRRAEAVFSCYEAIDRELAEIVSDNSEERNLVIMSDHGFGPLYKEICLNKVLEEAGLLKFNKVNASRRIRYSLIKGLSSRLTDRTKKRISKFLRKRGMARSIFLNTLVEDIDWEQTKLYSLGQFGCLFTNMRGREPMGIVADGEERQAMLDLAEAALMNYVDPDDGLPVITEFHRREELFHGSQTGEMPAAVITMRDYSYRGVCSLTSEMEYDAIIRQPHADWDDLAPTGCHRLEGVLLMHGPDVRQADLGEKNITDVTPTILSLLGLPGSEYFDGEIISEALENSDDTIEITRMPVSENDHDISSDPSYSEEDEEEIRRKLENLG
ncbi:MAG: alkaline phosphatase family protein, partial [Thermoleophilia bacterium]